MSATIGSKTVDTFGIIMYQGALRSQTEIFGREGVDGDGMHVMAKRGVILEGPTVRDVASAGLATTDVNAYYAMIDTPVTIVDQFGTSWTNTKIVDVVAWAVPLISPAGYWRVLANWKVLPSL